MVVVTRVVFQSLPKKKKQKNTPSVSESSKHFRGRPCLTGISTTLSSSNFNLPRFYAAGEGGKKSFISSYLILFLHLVFWPSWYNQLLPIAGLRESLLLERTAPCLCTDLAPVPWMALQRLNKEASHVSASRSQLSISASSPFIFFESWLHVPTTPLLLLLPAALTLVPGEPERAQRPYSRCEHFFFLFFSFFHPSERVSLTPPGRLARHMSAWSRAPHLTALLFPRDGKKKNRARE